MGMQPFCLVVMEGLGGYQLVSNRARWGTGCTPTGCIAANSTALLYLHCSIVISLASNTVLLSGVAGGIAGDLEHVVGLVSDKYGDALGDAPGGGKEDPLAGGGAGDRPRMTPAQQGAPTARDFFPRMLSTSTRWHILRPPRPVARTMRSVPTPTHCARPDGDLPTGDISRKSGGPSLVVRMAAQGTRHRRVAAIFREAYTTAGVTVAPAAGDSGGRSTQDRSGGRVGAGGRPLDTRRDTWMPPWGRRGAPDPPARRGGRGAPNPPAPAAPTHRPAQHQPGG